MASLLDTTGGYSQPIGLPGAEATNVTESSKDTFVNAATTGGVDGNGMIDFGVVAAKHAQSDNAACPLATGNLRPVGITSRRPKMAATPPNNIIGYATNAELAVYRNGDVFCMAAENVLENDQVVALATAYSPSTGITTNVGGDSAGAANGTTRIAVPGHVWKTTTAQGAIGIVAIYRRDIAPATT
jgi:hypothetical protein